MTEPTATQNSAERPDPAAPLLGLRASFSGWRLVLVLFYGAVALVFVGVVASIVVDIVKNKSLIPPPRTLVRYECSGATAPFTLLYLRGTERVKISSVSGVLEGTLQNKQFDWGSFGKDASQLGFVPPTGISFEDTQTLSLQMPGAGDTRCTRAAAPAKLPA